MHLRGTIKALLMDPIHTAMTYKLHLRMTVCMKVTTKRYVLTICKAIVKYTSAGSIMTRIFTFQLSKLLSKNGIRQTMVVSKELIPFIG